MLYTLSSFSSREKGPPIEDGRDVIPESAVLLALRAGESYLGFKKHFDVESSTLHLVSRLYWGELSVELQHNRKSDI